MEENLTRLLFLYGKPNRHNALRAIKGLSDSIIEINASFIDTKLLIRPIITNVFSTAQDPLEQVSQSTGPSRCSPLIRDDEPERD
jgi:hypothetical protein